MQFQKRIQAIHVTMFFIALFCSSKACAVASYSDAVSGRRTAVKNLINSTSGIPKEPARIFKTKDCYLRFVGAAPATHFVTKPGTPEDSAEDFLGKWRNLLVNESAQVRFERKRVNTRNGRSYLRYRQRYAGLEVFAAEIIVQVSATAGIEAVISDIMRDTSGFDTQRVSITALIDSETARRNATTFLAERFQKLSFGSGEPNLMIYAPDVLGRKGEPQLVWKTLVANIGEPLVKEIILVDAHNGEVAFHYSLIYGALIRQIYDYVTQEWYTDQSNWPTDIGEVNLTYDYLEDTYDFYYMNHSRDSYSGNGAPLIAYVRHPDPNNRCAWWDGAINIGVDHVTDDTIGHEFTHGVTDYTSNLIYSGESGAITESFSDMWGEWIDVNNGVDKDGNPDDPDDKWELWEDDTTDPPDKRNMKNPPKYGTLCGPNMPDRRGSSDFYDPEGEYDYGGVHHNCGVGNKLCCLLTDGDTFNRYTLEGMGIAKTADLFYECQLSLPPAADYNDLYHVIAQAAKNLQMTWEERLNIERACLAVEIANDPLEHWWKLDETSGTTAEDSVGDADGTLTNMEEADWVAGWIDGALDFDGQNDYVNLGALDALKGDFVTISAWIRAEYALPSYSPIVTQYNSNAAGYDLCLNSYGYPWFVLDDQVAQANEPVTPNTWYHLAGTYDGQELKIYVDGVLKGSQSVAKDGTDTAAYIGHGLIEDAYFNGKIDDVRIYNWAMDVDEILDKMYYGTSKFAILNESGVRVAWFDDLGNLFLKGSLTEGGGVSRPAATADDEFILQDSTGNVAVINAVSGDMSIYGSLQATWSDPAAGSDDFIITNSNNQPVAYIDDSGDLYLEGSLYAYEE